MFNQRFHLLFSAALSLLFFLPAQLLAVTIQGGDTLSVCVLQFPYTLKATAGLSQYEWNNGSTADSTIITQGGKYWVQASDNGTVVRDTIVVVSKNLSTEIYSTDKFYGCFIDTPWLVSSNEIFDPFGVWNTGDVGIFFEPTVEGLYWFKSIDSVFCVQQIDSVEVIGLDTASFLNLRHDITVCESAFPTTLYVLFGDNPEWQNGLTDFEFEASQAGVYSYTSSLSTCATVIDTITVSESSLTAPVLCCDTVICMPDSVGLSLPAGFIDYYWSTGQNAQKIFIGKEGVFNVSVSVTDVNNCVAVTNSILVEVKDSIPAISIFQNGAFLVVQPAGYTYQWFRNDTLLPGETTSGIKNELPGIYCAKVSRGICFDTVCYIYNWNPTGVKDLEALDFIFYPNPVNDFLNLETPYLNFDVKITDAVGNTAIEKTVNDYHSQIDCKNLAAGVYFLHISAAGSPIKSKIFLKY